MAVELLLLTVFNLSRWCFFASEFVAPVILPVVHVIKFLTGSVKESWIDALKSEAPDSQKLWSMYMWAHPL